MIFLSSGFPFAYLTLVKLPDFLNASLINDDKLKILIHHLDMFVKYVVML